MVPTSAKIASEPTWGRLLPTLYSKTLANSGYRTVLTLELGPHDREADKERVRALVVHRTKHARLTPEQGRVVDLMVG